MSVLQCFRVALGALAANKLRSALTMLGIIIGVMAVIVLVSLGRGLQKYIDDKFGEFGANAIYVFSKTPGEDATAEEMDKAEPMRDALGISNADAEALLDAPDVVAVAPAIERWAIVARGNYDVQVTLYAATPEMESVLDWKVAVGRFVTEEDLLSRARVCVLGWDTVADLFPPNVVPIGERVRIEGQSFRVVGILEEKGSMFGVSMDEIVIVPLTTAQHHLYHLRRRDGQPEVGLVQAEASSHDQMDAAVEQITDILRLRHRISYRDSEDFEVITQDEMLSAFKQITGALTMFLGLIAGISLLVGGIGIMNIMLVSVTERTREIGLRKAVGARRRDILGQFLVEAVVLSLVGGLGGIALGAVAAILTSTFVKGLTAHLTVDVILLATTVSASVGIFFGLYPAWRAAQLTPVDALRYE